MGLLQTLQEEPKEIVKFVLFYNNYVSKAKIHLFLCHCSQSQWALFYLNPFYIIVIFDSSEILFQILVKFSLASFFLNTTIAVSRFKIPNLISSQNSVMQIFKKFYWSLDGTKWNGVCMLSTCSVSLFGCVVSMSTENCIWGSVRVATALVGLIRYCYI